MVKNQNRRRFARINGDFNLKIGQPDHQKSSREPETGKIIDISASGLLIRFSKHINIGKVVQITFLTPKMLEIFKIDAKIVRVINNPEKRNYDLGVEFINMNKEIEKLLDFYLTTNQK